MPQSPTVSNWQPPLNYQPVPSNIPGIKVYAPVPERVKPETPVVYKCPQCGATTRYNVAAGGVACEHCGYTLQIKSENIGRGAAEYEFTLDTLEHAVQGWGVDRQELLCESCGAALSIETKHLAITCPFCSSNRVNVRPAPIDQLRPGYLIPFKIRPEIANRQAGEWLGKGWFHPGTLSASVIIPRFTGVYLPYWTFDTQIAASWKAQVGYERQEQYYDAGSKSWKSRTVIDWRWQEGQVPLTVDDFLLCGSSHLSHLILEQISPFDLDALVVYNPDFLAGWQAHTYNLTLPEAWERTKTKLRDQAREACYSDIPSHHVRNFSMVADYHNESWRFILLPVYLASYQFEDKVYQVMVNGQTGTVAGQKPVAWWKVWLAIAGFLSPGVFLGLIGLLFLFAGGVGIVPLFFAAILLVIGLIAAVSLYRKAIASEAS